MTKCSKCENTATQYHLTQGFVCDTCAEFCYSYLVDKYSIVDGEIAVEELTPSIDKGRDAIYVVMGDWSPIWGNQYNKMVASGEYTPIGIARTVEYLVQACRRTDFAKRQNLGLVPYYHEKAQAFYADMHRQIHSHMEQLAAATTQKTVVRKVRR